MAKIRILLLEDNRILREMITDMINKQPDVRVVAVSDGKHNNLLKARAAKPQVVLVDLGLDSRKSLDEMEFVKKKFPDIKIIGMGLAPTQRDILEFVWTGAKGFILREATVNVVMKTIRAVAAGETVLPYAMTGSLFAHVTEHVLLEGKRNSGMAVRMTEREKEIIALIADSMSNKEIAQQLNIATHTVKSHVHNIMEKLTLHSRLQIAEHVRDEKEF